MNDPTRMKAPQAAFGRLLLNETRLAFRFPLGVLLGIGLPVLLLIIFGSIPVLRQPTSSFGGFSYFNLSFPALAGIIVLTLCTVEIPRGLATYRETGILRTFSVTPLPPLWLLATQIVVNLTLAVIGLFILTTVGIVAFNLGVPKDWPGFVLAILLTITSFFALGLWNAAVAKNGGVASTIGLLMFYAMLFFGGIWIPRPIMPSVLLNIGNWTPLGASVEAIQSSMQGLFPSMQSLLVLAAYTVVFGYLAGRFFKWE